MLARRLLAWTPMTKPGCGTRSRESHGSSTTWGWGTTSASRSHRAGSQGEHCVRRPDEDPELGVVQFGLDVVRVAQVVHRDDERLAVAAEARDDVGEVVG